jgi:hypothetical protein
MEKLDKIGKNATASNCKLFICCHINKHGRYFFQATEPKKFQAMIVWLGFIFGLDWKLLHSKPRLGIAKNQSFGWEW